MEKRNLGIFLLDNRDKLLEQVLEHIGITFIALVLAIAVAVPVGIFIVRRRRYANPTLSFAGILQTIPSIALLGFLLPVLGIGIRPAIFALFLYALLPILRNTFTGISEVDSAVVEAARGMGLTNWQILRKVELPLAMPVIFAGIRTATVISIGIATLAAYIGAGGLGEFIFEGISLNDNIRILGGAIPAAILAIAADQLLALLQRSPVRKIVRRSGAAAAVMLLLCSATFMPRFLTSEIKAGFDLEFQARDDGYPALQEAYGLNFNTVTLSSELMYPAARQGYVDIIGGYATDGRIKAYDLLVLEDDRDAFPPYVCAPIVNAKSLQEFPQLDSVLRKLTNTIDSRSMTNLNYQVDLKKRDPREVAAEFLDSLGLLQPDQQQGGKELVIGGKNFTEHFILAQVFGMLIDGYTDYDVEFKTGLGGTKIAFQALQSGEIDVYPEYTGTAFLVLLNPDANTREQLIRDDQAVYDYVAREFSKQYGIEWLPSLGFENAYALMCRRAMADRRGWSRISDLPTAESN